MFVCILHALQMSPFSVLVYFVCLFVLCVLSVEIDATLSPGQFVNELHSGSQGVGE